MHSGGIPPVQRDNQARGGKEKKAEKEQGLLAKVIVAIMKMRLIHASEALRL